MRSWTLAKWICMKISKTETFGKRAGLSIWEATSTLGVSANCNLLFLLPWPERLISRGYLFSVSALVYSEWSWRYCRCLSAAASDYLRCIAGDDQKARELYKRVRVLCWIMTNPNNLHGKALAVRTTWVKRCNKFIFFSSVTNSSFPTIGLNVSEGRSHLTAKTVQAFAYCFKNYGNSYDWFLKADDDTYVIVENLRYFLSHHDPEQPVYFGHRFKQVVKPQGYFSGGAGYVLSRKALQRFVEVGLRNPLLCRRDGGAEDAEIGKCMQKLEIKVGDSVDTEGQESFHPFTPIAHLQGNYPPWFFDYAYHKVQSVSWYHISACF